MIRQLSNLQTNFSIRNHLIKLFSLTQVDQVQYYNEPVIEKTEDFVYNLLLLINEQDNLSKYNKIFNIIHMKF
jgi:hypothetical protein